MKKIIAKLFEPNEELLYSCSWSSIYGCCQTIAHYHEQVTYESVKKKHPNLTEKQLYEEFLKLCKLQRKWLRGFKEQLGSSLLGYANYKMFIACRLWAYVNR